MCAFLNLMKILLEIIDDVLTDIHVPVRCNAQLCVTWHIFTYFKYFNIMLQGTMQLIKKYFPDKWNVLSFAICVHEKPPEHK